MHHEAINFFESVEFSWTVVKKHWVFLMELSALSFLTLLCFNFFNIYFNVMASLNPNMVGFFGLSFVYNIFIFIATWTLHVNIIKINLDTLHGKKHSLEDLFALPTKKTWRYFAVSFIYGIMVFCGTLFFVFPGIYFAIKYFYAGVIAVDKNVGICEAGKISAHILQGEKWQMFAFLFVLCMLCILIIIAGLLCLGIGVIPAFFLAYWLFTFATLHIYKKLSHR